MAARRKKTAAKSGSAAGSTAVAAVLDAPSKAELTDLDEDTVAEASQALAEEREEEAKPRSLEEVVARHQPTNGGEPDYGWKHVPPADDSPERRDAPTMGHVELTQEAPPDLSDGGLRSLEDLMARFPLDGSGQYFIRVVRHQPKTWQGYSCVGVQRKIIDPMTYEQFVEVYGGGTYKLTVYGPPRGPGIRDAATGLLRPKALTNQIEFTVPFDKDGVFGIPPNPGSAIPEIDDAYPAEVDDMQQHPQVGRNAPRHYGNPMRPTTPADAKIHEAELNHDLTREEREEQRLEREREREREEREARAAVDIERMRLEERRENRTQDSKDVVIDRQSEELRELRKLVQEKQQGQQVDVAGIIGSVAQLHGGDSLKMELARQAEAHRDEVRRMGESHASDLQRIHETNRKDVEREQQIHNEQMRLLRDELSRERERMDRAIRDADERADRRVREIEAQRDRDVEAVRRDLERQMSHLESTWKSRLEDERRNHERDLVSRKDSHDSALRTEKVVFETQHGTLQQRLSEAQSEIERLRSEIAAKGDIIGEVSKIGALAEQLGYTRDSGGSDEPPQPTDWKQMLAGMGVNLAQNLPQMIDRAADAVQGLRAQRQEQQAAIAAAQQMSGPTPPALGAGSRAAQFRYTPRLGFAGEGAPIDMGSSDGGASFAQPPVPEQVMWPTNPPEQVQQPLPFDHAVPLRPSQQPPASPAPPQQPPAPPQQPPASPAPPQQPPAPRQAATPQQVTESGMPPEPNMGAIQPADDDDEGSAGGPADNEILMFRTPLEQAVTDGTPPEAVLAELVNAYGKDNVKVFASQLSADMVIQAVQRAPDGKKSPLLRFDGQQWLRDFERAARAL